LRTGDLRKFDLGNLASPSSGARDSELDPYGVEELRMTDSVLSGSLFINEAHRCGYCRPMISLLTSIHPYQQTWNHRPKSSAQRGWRRGGL